MKDWHDILKTCDLQNWKEALAAVMTYAQPNEFSSLCGQFKDIVQSFIIESQQQFWARNLFPADWTFVF